MINGDSCFQEPLLWFTMCSTFIHYVCVQVGWFCCAKFRRKNRQINKLWESGNRESQRTLICTVFPTTISYWLHFSWNNECMYPSLCSSVSVSIYMSPLLPKTRSAHVEAVDLCVNTGIHYLNWNIFSFCFSFLNNIPICTLWTGTLVLNPTRVTLWLTCLFPCRAEGF